MFTSNTFEIFPTRDVQLIDSVISALLPHLVTDQFPTFLSAAELIARPDTKALSVYANGALGGVVLLVGNEVHTLFLPSLRGAKATRAAREVLNHIWTRTKLTYLTSYAYSNRPEVLLFARLMGFHVTGDVDDGSTINGQRVVRTNLRLEKP